MPAERPASLFQQTSSPLTAKMPPLPEAAAEAPAWHRRGASDSSHARSASGPQEGAERRYATASAVTSTRDGCWSAAGGGCGGGCDGCCCDCWCAPAGEEKAPGGRGRSEACSAECGGGWGWKLRIQRKRWRPFRTKIVGGGPDEGSPDEHSPEGPVTGRRAELQQLGALLSRGRGQERIRQSRRAQFVMLSAQSDGALDGGRLRRRSAERGKRVAASGAAHRAGQQRQ